MLDETNEAGFFVSKGTSRLGYKAQIFMASCANHNAVVRAVFDKSYFHVAPIGVLPGHLLVEYLACANYMAEPLVLWRSQ